MVQTQHVGSSTWCRRKIEQLRTLLPQAELKAAVKEIFTQNKSRYGHRRIHIELRKQGWRVAKKTVLKLMRVLQLQCKTRSRKRFSSYQGEIGKISQNLLGREFFAARPNEKWVPDVTEFKAGEAKLYLSPIVDLCDRSIVAFTTSRHPTVEFAVSSLESALARLP